MTSSEPIWVRCYCFMRLVLLSILIFDLSTATLVVCAK